jgi:HAD superfamily hydrolase (TIGR01509 family)
VGTAPGVLFDIDGTLADTTYLHTIAWWQAFRQFGHDVLMADIHRAVGMGSDHLIDHLLGAGRDRDQDGDIDAAHAAHHAAFRTRLRPTPGARDLLEICARHGLRVVLASSAKAADLDALRTAIDGDAFIDGITTSADVEASKPDPDIIGVALRGNGIDATRAAFVGDSVWDVHAAAKAGIPCVALTCGGTSAAELTDAGAVEVYRDPADLARAFDRSLLARLA